jgi:hypothetical protein
MKIFKTIFRGVLILLCCILPADLFAQYYQDIDTGVHPADFDRIAQTGWQFLKLPTSARQAGMGGIFTSAGHGDATSALTNPASITDVDNIDLSLTTMNWIADIAYQSGSVVKNFGNWGTLGAHFIFVDYGDMQRTRHEDLIVNGRRTGTTEIATGLGTFSANDFAIGLSYGRSITNKLSVGGNVRFIQEKIDDATTSNWAVDIGTIYYTGFKTLRLAMVGRNFGPDANFAEWNERIQITPANVRMPMVFGLGAAIDIFEGGEGNPHLLTFAAEFTHPNDGPEKVNVGAEYVLYNLIIARGGYRFNYDEEGLTLGGGLQLKTRSFNVNFNYSYWSFGVFDSVNMISMGIGL